MSTTTLVNETCPAAVSTVTVVTNQFLIDSAETAWVQSQLTPAGSVLTLASLPVANTLKVFRNGQLQALTADYSRIDLVITLVTAPEASDVYVVAYVAQPA